MQRNIRSIFRISEWIQSYRGRLRALLKVVTLSGRKKPLRLAQRMSTPSSTREKKCCILMCPVCGARYPLEPKLWLSFRTHWRSCRPLFNDSAFPSYSRSLFISTTYTISPNAYELLEWSLARLRVPLWAGSRPELLPSFQPEWAVDIHLAFKLLTYLVQDIDEAAEVIGVPPRILPARLQATRMLLLKASKQYYPRRSLRALSHG